MTSPFTEKHATARMRMYFAAWAVLPIAVVLGIFSGGCAEKQAHAKVPVQRLTIGKQVRARADMDDDAARTDHPGPAVYLHFRKQRTELADEDQMRRARARGRGPARGGRHFVLRRRLQ